VVAIGISLDWMKDGYFLVLDVQRISRFIV